MATLHLTANNSREQIVLDNLIPMASDVLADKINNGVVIEKDGKRLLNKKDLSTFMVYATEQARKIYNEQQNKSSQAVCVLGEDIMSWAIHYFEEDSIEGKLYNEDGTEYIPPKPIKTATKNTTSTTYTPPAPKPKPQLSLFDLLDEKTDTATQEQPHDNVVTSVISAATPKSIQPVEDDPSVEEIADKLQQAIDEKNKQPLRLPMPYPPYYAQYLELRDQYPEHIVLIRLGDFYETFETDAETLSDELNLTLTSRKLTDEERIPMVGFPYHASDKYIQKIREKHGVVIVECNGDIVQLAQTVQADGKRINADTGEVMNEDIEELTESEMRQFDGDIQEPQSLEEPESTESDEQPITVSPSSFDEDTAIYLLKLLDGKMDLA